MFGYIKPVKCELKVREYEYYRAAYCGLCHALRAHCGIKARFIVNYDFTFLALALSAASGKAEAGQICRRRCIACPSGRSCLETEGGSRAADASVILTYLKLCDDVNDVKGLRGLFRARIPRFLLKRAYKKACAALPDYNRRVCALFEELNRLENSKTPSIDETADKFAKMLSALIDEDDTPTARLLREMFYHIGRFVYITDAWDDLGEDLRRGEYNPIAARFSVLSDELPDAVRTELLITLEQSRLSVLRAFELIGECENSGILRNIIELGMPAAVRQVTEKKEKTKHE